MDSTKSKQLKNNRSSSKGSQGNYKKSRTVSTDLPRQMPLAKKPSQQSNATEAKFASQMPEPDCMKKTRLEIPGFEENFVSGQIQVTSPSLI